MNFKWEERFGQESTVTTNFFSEVATGFGCLGFSGAGCQKIVGAADSQHL